MKSRRPYFVLFLLALLIRLLAAWPQQQPNYMDAAYSYVNALNLAAGRGFVEDFVWNYLGRPGLPPQPSHLYWMPLTSMLAWLGLVLGGVSYRAAQIPFVVLSALLAPLTYKITYALSRQPWPSWLAGLLAIFSGFYFPYWTAIDNFTPFALAGSLTLLAAWQGIGSREKSENGTNPQALAWFFAAGLLAGLSHLARADGPLLLVAIVIFYIVRLFARFVSPSHVIFSSPLHLTPNSSSRFSILPLSSFILHPSSFLIPLFLGYLLMMTPWFIRNWQVMGVPLSPVGSQTMWLANYDEFFSYNRELSARTFFAQGLGPVMQGRWWAFMTNLQTVLAVWGMIFLAPLALVGAWSLRRQPLIQLVVLYAGLLFIGMTLVFAFPGARGGLFHSGAALLPFIYAAAMVGLECAVDWVATYRRRWHTRSAKRVFGTGVVLMAVALSGFVYYGRVLKNEAWNQADALYPAIAAWVKQENPAATVMIGNPPAYRYHGGGLSVVVPNETIAATLQAAHRYHVDYLILDQNHPAPLTEVYTKTFTHPDLTLVQTFGDDAGNPVYIFKMN